MGSNHDEVQLITTVQKDQSSRQQTHLKLINAQVVYSIPILYSSNLFGSTTIVYTCTCIM